MKKIIFRWVGWNRKFNELEINEGLTINKILTGSYWSFFSLSNRYNGANDGNCEFLSEDLFTGFYDLNRRPIYAGDILNVPERWFEKNNKIIKGDNSVYFEDGMFKCNNLSLVTYKSHKGFEIIGNIHEK